MRSGFRVLCVAVGLAAAATLIVRGDDRTASGAPEVQFQLGNLLFEDGRYQDALQAYTRATERSDGELQYRSRLGLVKTALRVAEFQVARDQAEALRMRAPGNADAMAIYGDALWAAGQFDDAERWFRDTLALEPDSSRARHGVARALAARSRLDDALDEAQSALRLAPRDGELYYTVGSIYERLHRFDQSAAALTSFLNLLPNKDRSEKARWTRAQIKFLRAFDGETANEIVGGGAERLHTVPFRLVDEKVVVRAKVNGGPEMDFVLDTGSEETVISRQTARDRGVQPITYTLSAGVGEIGLRGLQLAKLDSLQIGTLELRHVPTIIKSPALRDLPTRERESLSPLALGLSTIVDYERRTLTIGRDLPMEPATVTLPMKMHRLAMVRGILNQRFPAYFVVDTGGEVISISAETATALRHDGGRRIPLKVYGTSGWDRDAFLLPGVSLAFEGISYQNFPVVVLNLRAPSVLLGFQVGGIVGHKFLSHYRVAMDLVRSEVRLRPIAN